MDKKRTAINSIASTFSVVVLVIIVDARQTDVRLAHAAARNCANSSGGTCRTREKQKKRKNTTQRDRKREKTNRQKKGVLVTAVAAWQVSWRRQGAKFQVHKHKIAWPSIQTSRRA